MEFIILPVATMAIGFLLGIICTDTFYDNERINKLEREFGRMKKQMEAMK